MEAVVTNQTNHETIHETHHETNHAANDAGREMQFYIAPAEKALLHLERTTDAIQREIHRMLRPYGLTSTQYSALRILDSATPPGLTCSDLGSRLISTDPDITRLLDRLTKQKLVRRRRDLRDRRAVLTEISEEGRGLVASIQPVLAARVRSLFECLSPSRLELFIELLEEACPAAHHMPHIQKEEFRKEEIWRPEVRDPELETRSSREIPEPPVREARAR